MKKFFFLSLMGMALAACSNEDLPFEETQQPTSKVLSNIISAEEAAEIATEAFNPHCSQRAPNYLVAKCRFF